MMENYLYFSIGWSYSFLTFNVIRLQGLGYFSFIILHMCLAFGVYDVLLSIAPSGLISEPLRG